MPSEKASGKKRENLIKVRFTPKNSATMSLSRTAMNALTYPMAHDVLDKNMSLRAGHPYRYIIEGPIPHQNSIGPYGLEVQ